MMPPELYRWFVATAAPLSQSLARALSGSGSRAPRRAVSGPGSSRTAGMMGIFCYRQPDIWPAGDLAVTRASRSYIGRKKPERAALSFAPHRSLLALYMWRLVGGALK